MKGGDIEYVIVASISGKTALKFAKQIEGARVVCVSGPPQWDCKMGGQKMALHSRRARLESLGVQIVDRAPTTLAGGFCGL
ncbi:MAG: hypothetical protein DRO01_07005 [Thermoproteota archaeon]|nr:MAG: hypothetical protein DRO01_07005 [Candidatus Korarchaeota archaeon]